VFQLCLSSACQHHDWVYLFLTHYVGFSAQFLPSLLLSVDSDGSS
jgi:hypothetical protein